MHTHIIYNTWPDSQCLQETSGNGFYLMSSAFRSIHHYQKYYKDPLFKFEKKRDK